ncbi:MAG: glucuronosyltransferase [Erythrobacter sp.]|jgi:UDP-N-acetylglucosamine:LPS N-acetylglucosamine transferase|nr:glucuronosyltransferase [Erythrobacter sp.]
MASLTRAAQGAPAGAAGVIAIDSPADPLLGDDAIVQCEIERTRINVRERRVLAVASGGGHWEQLMLLRSTLDRYDTRFATTDLEIARQSGIDRADKLPDCNQNKPISSAICAIVAMRVVLRHRPHVILSTGAAPGLFCILAGRLIGARTLWIDSIANGEQLSMCGRLSLRLADQCLTQWKHLARKPGPRYFGAVL